MKPPTIKNLKQIINNDFTKDLKPFCVELVWDGFLTYSKLTPENYDYWWYEVEEKEGINTKEFTFSFENIVKSRKFIWINKFIHLYRDHENAYSFLSSLLDVIACAEDGVDNVITVQFGNRIANYKNRYKQQTLFDIF